MLPIKVKAKIKNGKLEAKVKYPFVGGAELELGAVNRLKAIVKIPFVYSAKLLLQLKKKK